MPQEPYAVARPWRFPLFRLLAVMLAAGTILLMYRIWAHSLPLVERFYLPTYARLSLFQNLRFSPGTPAYRGRPFDVLFMGSRVATFANRETAIGPTSHHIVNM